MKIVADENIPNVQFYFSALGDIVLKPGRDINEDDVASADVLLVRAVTQVDAELLKNSTVKFVGTTTSGIDHLDLDFLNAHQIQWAYAAGCNTDAVVNYVIAVIALLQKEQCFPMQNARVGVIGVGKIGSAVVALLQSLGMTVLQNDPLRAEQEQGFVSTPLSEFNHLDLITLHVPLTADTVHPTFHLVNKQLLQQQQKNCVLLNASRGSVIDYSDLQEYGQSLYWCLDVWENEPYPDLEVVQEALVATPHIAGYSVQSKLRGMDIIYQKVCEKLAISQREIALDYPQKTMSLQDATLSWQDVVLTVYNPQKTTTLMKDTLLSNGTQTFDDLRQQFVGRYEFAFITLTDFSGLDSASLAILKKLKFKFA
jgi:erythronate-4-phosphate dehydrogenase